MKRFTIFLAILLALGLCLSLTSVSLAQERIMIHPGDDIEFRAWQHLGSKNQWLRLWAWNLPVIGKNPDLIFPDSILSLPPDSSSWRIQRVNSTRATQGWVFDFEFKSDTLNIVVSVGIDSTGMMYSMNGIDHKMGRRMGYKMQLFSRSSYGTFREDMWPWICKRKVTKDSWEGINYHYYEIPPGLPSYIPVDRF